MHITFTPQIKGKSQCIYVAMSYCVVKLLNVNEMATIWSEIFSWYDVFTNFARNFAFVLIVNYYGVNL